MTDRSDLKCMQLIQEYKSRLYALGRGICAHCEKMVRSRDHKFLGIFMPFQTGITGKHRIVAYSVCKKCCERPLEQLKQRIEDNLVRSGVFLEPPSSTNHVKP